jgi:uncharacterized protein (DUF1684 family)
VTDEAYLRELEDHRAALRAELRAPSSSLAAVARHELPLGQRVRVGSDGDIRLPGATRSIEVVAHANGFTVDGAETDPGQLDLGRYRLRLSHQHHPAVVILDAQSPHLRSEVELRWWPVDPRLRLRARLEPDGSRTAIASTASADRPAERAGWLPVTIAGVPVRLLATRLLEPGFRPDHLDVYFRDATTGHGSYEVGRYVTVEREGDEVVVDFNRAYNPACALSPFFNCPIPPPDNRLTVPIRAGEMAPLVRSSAARG